MDRVDRFFKFVCVLLSFIMVVSSLSIIGIISKNGLSVIDFDFFDCKDIVRILDNMDINMTSIVYVQNESGEWNEYCRFHGEENRIWVENNKIPKTLRNAFIAIEDQNFYTHSGVDWKRTGAAFVDWIPSVNILKGDQGGSTITQQLIKNVTSDDEHNASRKFREILRALSIEKMMSKDEILEAYLNTISLGNGICGVQVASNYYFNKDVDKLTLEECASLAAITKNPSKYNPISDPKENLTRRRLVLNNMYELRMISYKEYSDAYDAEVKIDNTQKNAFELPVNNYFIDALIENVITDLSAEFKCSRDAASLMLYNGGYKIYASVDTSIQNTMETVYKNVDKYFPQRRNGENVQSSMTIMDYEGHILGIVGGVGEKTVNRSLNRAIDAPRQPGSTMKPIGVYAPAIDNGTIYYSSILEDKPLEKYYPDGKPGPQEWYGYYIGNMSLIMAIQKSANTVPCHVLQELGYENSYRFLTKKLGLKHLTENDKNPAALALGGCTYGITSMESAAAYAVFGNGGRYYEPKTYYRIEKPNGDVLLNSGKYIQAIKSETSVIMNKLLQNVVYGANGTGGGIRNYSSMKVYAKTGTSSESNDLWMVAGTPYYVGSVWYGFDHNGTISNQGAAAKVWNDVMKEIHSKLEYKEFDLLPEIESRQYCRYSGKLKGKNCYSCAEGYFVSSHLPGVCDGEHVSVLDDFSNNIEEEENPEGQVVNPDETVTQPEVTEPEDPETKPPEGETPAEPPESNPEQGDDPSTEPAPGQDEPPS